MGYAGMWLIIDEAHITTIAVDPNYRGKDWRAPPVDVVDRRDPEGCLPGDSRVRESNLVAQRLYLKYHFRPRACVAATTPTRVRMPLSCGLRTCTIPIAALHERAPALFGGTGCACSVLRRAAMRPPPPWWRTVVASL